MSEILCCTELKPYKPKRVDHELKFSDFMKWTKSSAPIAPATVPDATALPPDASAYVIQVVRQKNFGALEWKRYFRSVIASGVASFIEIAEQDIIEANFEKLNTYVAR